MTKQKRLKDIASITLPKLSEVFTASKANALPVINLQYLRNKEPDRYASSGVLVHDGDLIVVMDGYNAGEVLFAKEGFLGNSLALIHPKKDVKKDYLFLSLKKQENFIRHMAKSDYINHVSVSFLSNIEIEVPSLEQQNKIINIDFKKYQSLLAIKNEAINMKQTIDASLKRKIRELFDDENIYRIKDLVKTETGITPKETSQTAENAIPFASARNIKNEVFPVQVDTYSPNNAYFKRCKKNEILMTCVGSDIGNACLTDKEYAFSQNLVRIFGSDKNTLELLFFYLLTHDLEHFQKSAAISFLSTQSLKNIKISFPENKRRGEVLKDIDNYFRKKELIEKELDKIESLIVESQKALIRESL